jgi:hypothetical protein
VRLRDIEADGANIRATFIIQGEELGKRCSPESEETVP